MVTVAEKFFTDARVSQHLDALVKILVEHQSNITGIKTADLELAESYAKRLSEFGNIRGGNLFFPYLGSGIGKGALVELADGSVKYDMIGGIGVHHFGHSHHELIRAALMAGLADTVMQGNLQQNAESVAFSKTLLEAAQKNGSRLKHCFITATGVMGGENSFKIAFQKNHPATRVLAFEGCFMGRTLALSQFTDKAQYREGLPLNFAIDYIPFFDAHDPKGSTERALTTLRRSIKRYPKQYAAMSFELILGEGGFYPGQTDFHRALMTECKANGIAILCDEVQSFARTLEPFAFQYYGLDELVDIVWIGKASQACALFFTEEYKPKPGLLSQTYTASTSAIAAGHVLVKELMQKNYFGPEGKIAKIHTAFASGLDALAKKYPDKISGPWGIGAMIGFTPFQGDATKATALIHALFKNGVMAFTAGGSPTRGRFLPPIGAITEHDIDAVLQILDKTLSEMTE